MKHDTAKCRVPNAECRKNHEARNPSATHSVPLLLAGTALLISTLWLGGCSAEHVEHAGHDHGGHDHAGQDNADHDHGDAGTAATDACAAHGAPKSLCFICDASLRDKGRLWCNEHARYEDRCWLCHPELEDPNRLWCNEHSLYEDECFLCHPELKLQARSSNGSHAGLMCNEHGVPEAECGMCRPEVASELQAGESLKVRLSSTESAAATGVRTQAAEVIELSEGIDCLAELSFNQTRYAHVVSPVAGIIEQVEAGTGDQVEDQALLARIHSQEIADAIAHAVLTHQTLERERRLYAERVTPASELQRAEAEHRSACQQLRVLGFSEEQIEKLEENPDQPVLMSLCAPFAGEVIAVSAVRGSRVAPGERLFSIANTTNLWAMLRLSESALRAVKVGQTVELRVDARPGDRFTGRLTWIASEVDPRTRTVQARAEIGNSDGRLKAGMFGRARIITSGSGSALAIPVDAVQRVGGREFAFVQIEPDLFEARALDICARHDDVVDVVAGLSAGESVVTQGSFQLKSQFLLSRLGAGCTHE